jgi:hypothetical protein
LRCNCDSSWDVVCCVALKSRGETCCARRGRQNIVWIKTGSCPQSPKRSVMRNRGVDGGRCKQPTRSGKFGVSDPFCQATASWHSLVCMENPALGIIRLPYVRRTRCAIRITVRPYLSCFKYLESCTRSQSLQFISFLNRRTINLTSGRQQNPSTTKRH